MSGTRDFKSDAVLPTDNIRRPSTPHPHGTTIKPIHVSVLPKTLKGLNVNHLSTATKVELQLTQAREQVIFPTLIMTTYVCPSRSEPIKVCLLGNPDLQQLFLHHPNYSRSKEGSYWTMKTGENKEDREFKIYPWIDASTDPKVFFDKAAILLFFSKETIEQYSLPKQTIKTYCEINVFLHLRLLDRNQFTFDFVEDFKIGKCQSLDPRVTDTLQQNFFKSLYRYHMIPPIEQVEIAKLTIPKQKISPASPTDLRPLQPGSGPPTIRLEQPAQAPRKKCCS